MVRLISVTAPTSIVAVAVAICPLPTLSVIETVGTLVYPAPYVSNTIVCTSIVDVTVASSKTLII